MKDRSVRSLASHTSQGYSCLSVSDLQRNERRAERGATLRRGRRGAGPHTLDTEIPIATLYSSSTPESYHILRIHTRQSVASCIYFVDSF